MGLRLQFIVKISGKTLWINSISSDGHVCCLQIIQLSQWGDLGSIRKCTYKIGFCFSHVLPHTPLLSYVIVTFVCLFRNIYFLKYAQFRWRTHFEISSFNVNWTIRKNWFEWTRTKINQDLLYQFLSSCKNFNITLVSPKRAGLFGPISQPGGGRIPPP